MLTRGLWASKTDRSFTDVGQTSAGGEARKVRTSAQKRYSEKLRSEALNPKVKGGKQMGKWEKLGKGKTKMKVGSWKAKKESSEHRNSRT